MKNTKFLVKVKRAGNRATQYVQSIDQTSVGTTSNRSEALIMGRFTAEDAMKFVENSRCTPELVPVEV